MFSGVEGVCLVEWRFEMEGVCLMKWRSGEVERRGLDGSS